MAEITYDPTEEGELFSATELNQTFAGISAALNDVPTYGMPEGALRHEHFAVDIMPEGATIMAVFNSNSTVTDNVYPGHGSDTVATSGTAWEVCPPGSVLSVNSLNNNAGYDISNGGEIQGILVLANILIASIAETTGGNDVLYQAVVALQAEIYISGSWDWKTIPETERFVSQGASYDNGGVNDCDIDVPIRYLITSDTDHVEAGRPVRAVRVVHCGLDLSPGSASGGLDILARRGNLTVIPLHMLKA